MPITIRQACPDDFDAIRAVIDDWWGREIAHMVPRLFLDHFFATSSVAEIEGSGELVGFLIGFVSPSRPERAYVHFIGVAPHARAAELGRTLYERFFELARGQGCTVVNAITGPVNEGSIAFHGRMGFDVRGPVPDYDGPGEDRMVFERPL